MSWLSHLISGKTCTRRSFKVAGRRIREPALKNYDTSRTLLGLKCTPICHRGHCVHFLTTKCSYVQIKIMSNKVKLLRGCMAPLMGRSESKLYSCEAKSILDHKTKNLHLEAKVFRQQPKAFLSSGPNNGQAYTFSTLNVTVPSPFVFNVEVNRPKKMNALNKVRSNIMLICHHDHDLEHPLSDIINNHHQYPDQERILTLWQRWMLWARCD